MTRAHRGQHRGHPSRRRVPADQRRPACTGRPTQARPEAGVAQPRAERRAEGVRIGGRHEQSREAADGPPQRLGHPTDGGRDDRQPDRQRLGDDHPVRLETGRQDQQVRRLVLPAQLVARPRPDEADPVGHAGRLRPGGGAARRTGDRGRAGRRRCSTTAVRRCGRARRAAGPVPCAGPRRRRTGAGRHRECRAPLRPGPPRAGRRAPAPGAAGNGPSSRSRVHALVVTTARACVRTARSSSAATATSPNGMWTRTTSRSRADSGTRTAPAADAIRPSSRTIPPSGTRPTVCASRDSAAASGRGHSPGTTSSRTSQPGRGELVADPPVVGVPAAGPRGVVDAVGDDDVDGGHGTATDFRPQAPSHREDAHASRATGRTSSTREMNRIVSRLVSLGRTYRHGGAVLTVHQGRTGRADRPGRAPRRSRRHGRARRPWWARRARLRDRGRRTAVARAGAVGAPPHSGPPIWSRWRGPCSSAASRRWSRTRSPDPCRSRRSPPSPSRRSCWTRWTAGSPDTRGTVSSVGARFDMEVDSVLVLLLSVYAARSLGVWVLAVGSVRYVRWIARPGAALAARAGAAALTGARSWPRSRASC